MADGKLPWGLDEKQLKPNSVEELSKNTLKAFSIGATNPALKVNPFQKLKEEKEKKKQKEEEETAKVLEEFVATFQQTETKRKEFVRGDVINPDKDSSAKAGTLYQPTTTKSIKDLEQKLNPKPKPSPEPVSSCSGSKSSKKKITEKKKSILEMFGEELKRMQDERKERTSLRITGDLPLDAPEVDDEKRQFKVDEFSSIPKGSHDHGDPLTTNLYIGNINPKMTEEMLCQHFGKFGPLASVKIMWPRTEEERSRNRNCGFVAFMRRRDAERSLDDMKGSTILGYEVEIGWGKAVPLPPTPFYVAPDHSEEKTSFIPDPPSGIPFNAQSLRRSRSRGSRSNYSNMPPPESGNEPHPFMDDDPGRQSFDEMLYNSIIKVVIPSDKEILRLIHRMIEFIIREGPMFEAMIMNKEMGNPKFQFLFDNQSPAHIYYRWKLFSILQGDSPETWKTDEFRMFESGSLWKPPPLKNLRGKVLPPIMEIVKKGQLSSENWDFLEEMLRNVTMERSKIKDGMIWCMEHAESAEEIVECLTESLCLTETSLPLKIARLFLVNDILLNSSARVSHASRFRRGFEGKLVPILEHFHTVLISINSRIRAESFKRRVLKCLQAWDQLSVYHFNFVDKLRELFVGKSQEEIEKKKAFETVAALMSLDTPMTSVEDEQMVDNNPIDFSGGKGFDVDEEIDGEPLPDIDVDGVPLDDEGIVDEDVDGVPMDEDIVPTTATNTVVHSKWELVDYGQGSSSDTDNEDNKRTNISLSSTKRDDEIVSTNNDNEKRQILRDVELKVLELVEALESSGGYTQDEITERAAKFREKLVKEATEANLDKTTPTSLKPKDKKDEEERTSEKKREKDIESRKGKELSPRRSRRHSSREHSSSPQRDHSRSPSRKKKRHTSPTTSKRRSRSRDKHRTNEKQKSPTRKRSRSRSPHGRHRSKSPHNRGRSRSPHHRTSSRKDKHRSRSRSPHRSKRSRR